MPEEAATLAIKEFAELVRSAPRLLSQKDACKKCSFEDIGNNREVPDNFLPVLGPMRKLPAPGARAPRAHGL